MSNLQTLLWALKDCIEWMEDDGCDCGVDEPGSCALCRAKQAVKEIEEE